MGKETFEEKALKNVRTADALDFKLSEVRRTTDYLAKLYKHLIRQKNIDDETISVKEKIASLIKSFDKKADAMLDDIYTIMDEFDIADEAEGIMQQALEEIVKTFEEEEVD